MVPSLWVSKDRLLCRPEIETQYTQLPGWLPGRP